jgi:hypothetical protein
MTTLRCTGKLTKRLGIRDPGEPPPPENVLGDWFANILYTRHGHYVLVVSERSLLPVLTTARDLDNLVPRFMNQLGEVLSALGVRRELIDRELSRMEPLYFGRTNSRSILGSMNDFVQMFKYMLPDGQDLTLLNWSLQLAKAPCGPIDMERPNRLTCRLLENPHDFKVIDGGKS